MIKRPINARDITLGQPIPHNVFEPDGTLLLRKGHIVDSESQIESLLTRGLFVLDESIRPANRSQGGAYKPDVSPIDLVINAYQRLERAFDRLPELEHLPDRISTIARDIRTACQHDTDAAMGAILLAIGQNRRYVIRHPIFVAIICHILLAVHQVSEEEAQSILSAALTMNISIIKLQELLHRQAAPLTPDQKARLQAHPEQSVEILEAAGVTDTLWLRSVLEHHENLDGGGYPRQLREDEICVGGQLLLFADHYCAKVTARSYRDAVLPNVALRDIFLNSKYLARAHMASAYIKLLSLYPPGTYVQLRNGEIAVVTKRGRNINCPIVFSVIGASGMPLVAPVQRDTNDESFAITQPVKAANIRLAPGLLWGYPT